MRLSKKGLKELLSRTDRQKDGVRLTTRTKTMIGDTLSCMCSSSEPLTALQIQQCLDNHQPKLYTARP